MRVITIISLCLFNLATIPAQKTITGTVSDYTGPLPFANVIIEGTDSGTVADAKGDFSIETNKGDMLTISYVGFTPKHITIENTKHLDISLDIDSLDEVIITGYGYSKTRSFPICLAPPERSSRSSQEIIGPNFATIENPIYPNPSSTGHFNLNLLERYDTVNISIISITGQVIFSTSYSHPNTKINIDLSRFATGIYIVNTIADGKRLPAQKVIRS